MKPNKEFSLFGFSFEKRDDKGNEIEGISNMADREESAMAIIASAGDAKGYAFEALTAAENGEFDKADALLKQAKETSTPAHKVQMDMIVDYANGDDKGEVDILMVHAQDHLMTSILAQELIEEIIKLCKKIDVLEKRCEAE